MQIETHNLKRWIIKYNEKFIHKKIPWQFPTLARGGLVLPSAL